MDQPYDIIDTRDEDRLHYNEEGVAKLASSDHAAAWYVRLLPGKEVGERTHDNAENNAIVLSGTLTYRTGMADTEVHKGGWTVARTGEPHGYGNNYDWPLHLLIVSPASELKGETSVGDFHQRVFRPSLTGESVIQVYRTRSSRGQQIALTPGATRKVDYSQASVLFVLEGRIMALVAGEKVSLDPGEGIFVRKCVVETVGVAGQSVVAVITTRR